MKTIKEEIAEILDNYKGNVLTIITREKITNAISFKITELQSCENKAKKNEDK